MTNGCKFQLIINTDDEEEMNTYIEAAAASAALYEFSFKLRSWDKHGLPKEIETPVDAVQYIREVFNEFLSEYVK